MHAVLIHFVRVDVFHRTHIFNASWRSDAASERIEDSRAGTLPGAGGVPVPSSRTSKGDRRRGPPPSTWAVVAAAAAFDDDDEAATVFTAAEERREWPVAGR